MPARYIAVSGSIATGKTTLCKILGQMLDIPAFYEQVSQNPFLAPFYSSGLGMSKYAFHSQMWFLNYKRMQLQEIANTKQPVVMERCLDENLIFSQLVLTNEENKIYTDCYQLVAESLALLKPVLIVYLRLSLNEQLRRIKQRSIPYEQNIDEQYLVRLNSKYEEWIASYEVSPVLAFNSEKVSLKSIATKACLHSPFP